MQRFNVTYIELIQGNTTISRYYDGSQESLNSTKGYGTLPTSQDDKREAPETFHDIIANLVLPKVVPNKGNRITKVSQHLIDGFEVYYTTSDDYASDSIVLVCFTRADIPKIIPIRVLSDLKLHDTESETDTKLEANINRILDRFNEDLMQYKNETMHSDTDSAELTENELRNIIQIMNDNIDKFLERQERVSLLVDKTGQLNTHSHNFKKKARKIKDKMWWQRMKNTTVLIFATILMISAIFMFFYIW